MHEKDGASRSAITSGKQMEVAVLAGGCFWGVQGVFQRVKGVANAVSGYAGGPAKSPSKPAISAGSL